MSDIEEEDELLDEEEADEEEDDLVQAKAKSNNNNNNKSKPKDKDIYSKIFDSIVGEGTNREIPVDIRIVFPAPDIGHGIVFTHQQRPKLQPKKIMPPRREWSESEQNALR